MADNVVGSAGEHGDQGSEDLVLELTPDELEQLRSCARTAGISAEEYARDAIHEYLAAQRHLTTHRISRTIRSCRSASCSTGREGPAAKNSVFLSTFAVSWVAVLPVAVVRETASPLLGRPIVRRSIARADSPHALDRLRATASQLRVQGR
jgi:hypothetical protein